MAHPMSEPWSIWHPIDTAPKDGRRFLFSNGRMVGVGQYINGRAFAADSWQGENLTEPTHWMPLPDLPR